MDPFEVPENLTEVEDKDLDALAKGGREALAEIAAKAKAKTATSEDAAQAKEIAEALRSIDSERENRMAVHEDILGLADEFAEEEATDEEATAEETPEAEATEETPEAEVEEQPEAEQALEPVTASAPKSKAKTTSVRQRVAATGRRAQPPAETKSPLEITAAPDVQGFSAGQSLDDMDNVAKAFIARSKGFNQPGTGAQYAVAQIRRNAYDDLTVTGSKDDQKVINYAGSEKRLKGGSLTAAAGWCAPSETLYDLCDTGASTEGMVDLPEIQVNRGGVRFTNGPDFSALYNGGFHLTEAEVIAGQEKNCIEIPCPAFDEVRLEAVGICLTSPILMERGYPELVSAFLGESMIAHQWNVNNILLNKMITAGLAGSGGTAIQAGGLGSIAAGALGALELVVQSERTANRWGQSETIEAMVPAWLFGAMRLDYSLRNGVNMESVSDGDITRWFADRNISVKPVVGWQDLPSFTGATGTDQVAYPTTFQALIYRSGTFVKGTDDVISLSAVHDSANLKKNQYTALFYEEAVLLLQRCYGAKIVEMPVCAAGTTGAANLTDCNSAPVTTTTTVV